MYQNIFSINKNNLSGSYSPHYVQTWETAKYNIDPEATFSLQAGQDCVITSLYGLCGLKVIGSYQFEEEAAKVIERFNNQNIESSCQGNLTVCDAVNTLRNRKLINPLLN